LIDPPPEPNSGTIAMKIKSIDALRLRPPAHQPGAPPRRPSYIENAPHAFPINKYREFPQLVRQIPGGVGGEIWIRVTAEDGSWGIGQTHWGHLVEPIVRHSLAPLLIGRDCFAIEFLSDLMWRLTQRYGAVGLASVARSGIDQALWDLKGKLLGVPVYSLLGGPCRNEVECYATTDDLDWAMELGFKSFKVSNPVHYDDGLEGINRLEEKIARARDQVGPEAELMFNPNMSFNVEFAVRLMERMRPYRLRWLEEPLVPGDLEGHIRIKQACPTIPLATGEDHHGRFAFRQLVEHRCVDVLQPDLRWCGGLSEGVKIYTIGEAAGVITIPHGGANTPAAVHFAFAMPESPMAEYFLASAPGIPLRNTTLPGLPVAVDGKLKLSDVPGFGLELRPEDFEPWL
jgi:L-rhamnonate dehydratase